MKIVLYVIVGLLAGYSGSASNIRLGAKSQITKRASRRSLLSALSVHIFINLSYNLLTCGVRTQIESFWSLWTHVNPPSGLLPTTDYLLFHSGVRRPVWEDPLNRTGGKWIIRLRKGLADRLWEDLVLAVIGDQFDECGPDDRDSASAATTASDGGEWPEICGCTISVRQNEDILTVWNRSDADAKVKEKIKCVIASLPCFTSLIHF